MDRDSVSEHTSVKNGSTLLSFFFLGFIFMLYALSLYGSYEFLINWGMPGFNGGSLFESFYVQFSVK